MNKINISMPSAGTSVVPAINADKVKQGDAQKAARQVEEVFLNELFKCMFQNTELAKDKVVSSYLPVITAELSKSISSRGIGIQDFLIKNQAFNIAAGKGTNSQSPGIQQDAGGMLQIPAQSIKMKSYDIGAE